MKLNKDIINIILGVLILILWVILGIYVLCGIFFPSLPGYIAPLLALIIAILCCIGIITK